MKNISKLYTDLIEEENHIFDVSNKYYYKDIEVIKSKYKNYFYSTIYFNNISNSDNYFLLEKVLVMELKRYIKVTSKDNILVVGLGNEDSTPDALGPKTLDNIMVTRHLKILSLIKELAKEIKATKLIVIDSLKASKINRLLKTIQITNSGIHPGSGINNNRGEISKKTLNIDVIAIGIPTVVDIRTILNNLLKKDIKLDNNLVLTPTDIDYQIKVLSKLLGESINKSLHKKLYPTK